MNRHVTSLPIPNNIKTKLVKNGIESVTDLKNLKPTDLIKGFLSLIFNRFNVYKVYNLRFWNNKK